MSPIVTPTKESLPPTVGWVGVLLFVVPLRIRTRADKRGFLLERVAFEAPLNNIDRLCRVDFLAMGRIKKPPALVGKKSGPPEGGPGKGMI